MIASKVIEIYQSQPLWEMRPDKLTLLHRELSEWRWNREYRYGGQKREELEVELYKIELLLEGYHDVVECLF